MKPTTVKTMPILAALLLAAAPALAANPWGGLVESSLSKSHCNSGAFEALSESVMSFDRAGQAFVSKRVALPSGASVARPIELRNDGDHSTAVIHPKNALWRSMPVERIEIGRGPGIGYDFSRR